MAEEEYDFDPWEASSGLPAYLQVRIDNPHFGYDVQVGNGTTCLFKPEGTILSGDGIDEPAEFTQFYGCGPGWEPAGKGGTRAVREDGKARQFNENVAYAWLFKSLKEAAKQQDMLDQLRKKGTPFDAATWSGLTLDLERIQLPEFEGQDGKMVKRNLLTVKQIVKMGDAKVAPKPDEEVDEMAKVSSKAEESASSNGGSTVDELDPKTKAKLKAAARAVREAGGEHRAFVEQAFEIDGVLDNAVAEQAIMDQGDGSIWASVEA